MKTSYLYYLRPTAKQTALLEEWLELLRKQYNYRLSERFNWWEYNRSPINACPLICHLPELKEQPNYYSQKADLVESKKLFPELKKVQSQVLQDCVKRVDKAFERFIKKDVKGKRLGKPRFKGQGRYRSFTFPQIKQDCIRGNKINLSKIGFVKFVKHRDIPAGFKIKTVTVIKKAEKFYISISLEDVTVPVLSPGFITDSNTLGIDLGLNDFIATSEEEYVTSPKFYRKSQKKLKKAQKSVSRKKKGSNRRKKAIKRLNKVHTKITNQRKDFHFKTAKSLVAKRKNIAYENLNVKGMSKGIHSKSIHDAGWSSFISILKVKAESAGLNMIGVKPHGTSIDCSCCGYKVKKHISDRVHNCPNCQISLNRDHNAAINIKNRAVGHSVLKAQDMSDAIAGVTEKPTLYA